MSLSQKLVLALLVCFPVPALTGTGLALPLPSGVYQVVVGLAEGTHAVAVRLGGFDAVINAPDDRGGDAQKSG